MSEPQTDVDSLTYEAAMGELEAIVERLEKGNVPLQDSIDFYERGVALKDRCDRLLKEVEMRVERVRLKGDGTSAGTAPLDAEDDVPF